MAIQEVYNYINEDSDRFCFEPADIIHYIKDLQAQLEKCQNCPGCFDG